MGEMYNKKMDLTPLIRTTTKTNRMKGITIEDVYLMIKYDIGAGNENPERHIEKYVKRMCKECHGTQINLKDMKTEENIIEHQEGTIIINGGEPLKDCPTDWDEAKKWEEGANIKKEDWEPKWNWDCGFKLDFDAYGIVSVSSRFYPPKTYQGDTWDGNMTIKVLGKEVLKKEFDCPDLETLRKEVESFWKHYKAIITSRHN